MAGPRGANLSNVLHPGQSCLEHTFTNVPASYARALAVYVPVYLVPALLVHRQKLASQPQLLLPKLAQGIGRSALFLTAFIALAFGSVCAGFAVTVGQLDAHGQPVYTTRGPFSAAAIPDLSCRNLCLQLCRGLPGAGANTRPSAAVAAVLAAHHDLPARLEAVPRYHSDTNMVDHVGKQRETVFSNMLTLLFAGRL
ncbi:TMEM135_C_rich domain-containing protein [Haematococcus lacustris]|uniref:TMEM135_C_rich domain-containing protein n=1 Tax=Haematococcus lacustris TaxID=44745 RepID=A0A6A0A1U0_HAELA|nr:TMEM135_C_rich domain-containing protein [Haematococcus lacustris]